MIADYGLRIFLLCSGECNENVLGFNLIIFFWLYNKKNPGQVVQEVCEKYFCAVNVIPKNH